MGSLLDRIAQLAESEGMKITLLERVIGASKGVLSRAISNGTDIQAKWLQAIVENYPAYSERWLLTGSGPMLRTEHPTTAPIPAPPSTPEPPTPTVIYERDPRDIALIAAQEKTIASQEKAIAQLEQLTAAREQVVTAKDETLAAKQEVIERDRLLAAAERKSTLYGRGHVSDTESTALDFAR